MDINFTIFIIVFSGSNCDFYVYYGIVRILMFLYYCIVFVIGFVGNLLVLIVIV